MSSTASASLRQSRTDEGPTAQVTCGLYQALLMHVLHFFQATPGRWPALSQIKQQVAGVSNGGLEKPYIEAGNAAESSS